MFHICFWPALKQLISVRFSFSLSLWFHEFVTSTDKNCTESLKGFDAGLWQNESEAWNCVCRGQGVCLREGERVIKQLCVS